MSFEDIAHGLAHNTPLHDRGVHMAPIVRIVSQGDPASDARSFRRCLGVFATGVTVITAQCGDQKAGVTANSFSSLSLDPPLILWSINRSARSFPVFRDATHF